MAIWNRVTALDLAHFRLQEAIGETNAEINRLGSFASDLFKALNEIQDLFDTIRGVPTEKRPEYEAVREKRANWKAQAEIIEEEYETAIKTSAKGAAVGTGAGVAIATFGPNAAMGVVTTFGVASTGAQISTLTGAAATQAALACLGGGTLAAGGGGVAAGEALLALAGPVGWSIAGVSILVSGIAFLKLRKNNKRLERVFLDIYDRDFKAYQTAKLDISERIKRIKDETNKIENTIDVINTYALDYAFLNEQQKNTLWVAYDLMVNSTQLLVEPIKGLQPNYSESDAAEYFEHFDFDMLKELYLSKIELFVYLANLLYRIELDETDAKLLTKSFQKNKNMLKDFGISKEAIHINFIKNVLSALASKYYQEGLIQ